MTEYIQSCKTKDDRTLTFAEASVLVICDKGEIYARNITYCDHGAQVSTIPLGGKIETEWSPSDKRLVTLACDPSYRRMT